MGKELFGTVTAATGLPDELISEELTRLLATAGVRPEDLTIDDLRQILADYVQDILVAAKEYHSKT